MIAINLPAGKLRRLVRTVDLSCLQPRRVTEILHYCLHFSKLSSYFVHWRKCGNDLTPSSIDINGVFLYKFLKVI